MGNFLPRLAHGTNRSPMISKATKQKLYCSDDRMNSLLHKWKKSKSRGRATNTGDTFKGVSEDHLEKGEKEVIRVKVVLTKEEAARLLSMCIRGEEKTLAQLMSQLESRHESAVTSHGGWRPVLESIPEEYYSQSGL